MSIVFTNLFYSPHFFTYINKFPFSISFSFILILLIKLYYRSTYSTFNQVQGHSGLFSLHNPRGHIKNIHHCSLSIGKSRLLVVLCLLDLLYTFLYPLGSPLTDNHHKRWNLLVYIVACKAFIHSFC